MRHGPFQVPLKRLGDEPQTGKLARKIVAAGLPIHHGAQGADNVLQSFVFDERLLSAFLLRHNEYLRRARLIPARGWFRVIICAESVEKQLG